MNLSSITDRIRSGGQAPFLIDLLLAAATPVQRMGMAWRLRQPSTRVNAHVISYGNITAGGTGKTPAVIEHAQQEVKTGRRVAVLTRGYGAAKTQEPLIVTPDDPRDGLAERVGDEPALIARHVPEAFIVKSADRVAGARAAVDEHQCHTLILDDGFQAVALAREENVLVVDATNPFGNGHLLPRGILREPIAAVRRATKLILTHCDQVQDVEALAAQFSLLLPEVPIRKTKHAPSHLWRLGDGEGLDLKSLRGKEVAAVCAIGNPESFFRTIESLGATITARRAFRDHADIPPDAIPEAEIVVTTEKDAVRMRHAPEGLLALAIELRNL